MFESWDDEKLKKYNITVDDYDHIDVAERPSILINNYHTHRQPYFTMICLWDERVNFLLSSRYDPLKVETGKAVMQNDDDEDDTSSLGLSSAYSSAKRRSPNKSRGKGKKEDDGGIKETITEIINIIKSSSLNVSPTPSIENTKKTGLALMDLNSLYDKYVGHLKLLKKNDMLTDKRKADILGNIEEVYGMILETHGKNISIDNCSGNSNSKVS